MAVSDGLNDVWTAKEQGQDLFTGRAQLEDITNTLLDNLQRFEDIKLSGSFDTIPTDLRTALLAWETILKTAKADCMANADIVAVYQWRP